MNVVDRSVYVTSSFYVRNNWIYPGTWCCRQSVSRAAREISAGKRGDRRSRLRAVRGGAAQGSYGRYKGERVNTLKQTFMTYPAIHTITLYPTAPLYNIIITFDTILRQKGNLEHEK